MGIDFLEYDDQMAGEEQMALINEMYKDDETRADVHVLRDRMWRILDERIIKANRFYEECLDDISKGSLPEVSADKFNECFIAINSILRVDKPVDVKAFCEWFSKETSDRLDEYAEDYSEGR